MRTSDGALERGQEPFLKERRSGLSGMLQIMCKQYSKFAQLNYFLNDERRSGRGLNTDLAASSTLPLCNAIWSL